MSFLPNLRLSIPDFQLMLLRLTSLEVGSLSHIHTVCHVLHFVKRGETSFLRRRHLVQARVAWRQGEIIFLGAGRVLLNKFVDEEFAGLRDDAAKLLDIQIHETED